MKITQIKTTGGFSGILLMQVVVISASGSHQSPDRGDYVAAFALPETK